MFKKAQAPVIFLKVKLRNSHGILDPLVGLLELE